MHAQDACVQSRRGPCVVEDGFHARKSSTRRLNAAQTVARPRRIAAGATPLSCRIPPSPGGSDHHHAETGERRSLHATSARAPGPSGTACTRMPAARHPKHERVRPRARARSPPARGREPDRSASPHDRGSGVQEHPFRRGCQQVRTPGEFAASRVRAPTRKMGETARRANQVSLIAPVVGIG